MVAAWPAAIRTAGVRRSTAMPAPAAMTCRVAVGGGRHSVKRRSAVGCGCAMESRSVAESGPAMEGWRAMGPRFTVVSSSASVDRSLRGAPDPAARSLAPGGP